MPIVQNIFFHVEKLELGDECKELRHCGCDSMLVVWYQTVRAETFQQHKPSSFHSQYSIKILTDVIFQETSNESTDIEFQRMKRSEYKRF